MNCFNHPDESAIALCKACNKALCSECLTDMGHGIACKNSHEQEVSDINMIINKSTKIYNAAPKNTLIMPIFNLFLGVVFAGFGFFSKGGMTDLPFVMGVGFIVIAIVMMIRNRALFNNVNG